LVNLIVNADDFGISEKVNEGIFLAHTKGILTSTSLIANGIAFNHALNVYKATPTISVGVHLTLVEEKPLSNPRQIKSLIGKNGKFHHSATNFAKKYVLGHICFKEVYQELEAQILKINDSGLPISHLDSHQHVHMLPKIFSISTQLAKKYKIPAIRMPYEKPHSFMVKRLTMLERFLQLLVLNFFCRLNKINDLEFPNHFFGFFYSGNLNYKHLQTTLRKLPSNGLCEIICHPGIYDPDNRYTHWGYHWSDELEALVNPKILDFINNKNIRLVSYRHLANI